MQWLRDLRHSCRALVREPGFSLAVMLTSALGIAAATAVYSLVYAILLRPYPYTDPERLVRVQTRQIKQGGALLGCSLLDIDDYRRRATTLEDVGAFASGQNQILSEGETEVAIVTQVNPAALNILGIAPIAGRALRDDEDRPGGDVHKALISYGLWQSKFGSDPKIVGQVLRTERVSYTIVGIMPPAFAFPLNTSIWTPMESFYATLVGDRAVKRRESRFYQTIARLKPGVTLERAEEDLNAVAEGLEREYPRENEGVRVKLTPLREFEVGSLTPYLRLLLAGVLFVMLICCANVAGLLLVRAAGRRRNLAIQTALGASRARIVCALLIESIVLALAGGLLGVGLAYAGVKAVVALIPVALPFWMTITIDRAVLGMSLIITVATGVGFGLLPALHASKVDLNEALKEGARGSYSRSRLRFALIVGEVAASLLLLVCAGLLMRAFVRLHRVDTGFQSDGLMTVRVVKYEPGSRQETAVRLDQMHRRVLGAIRGIPGVASAAVTNLLPFTGTQVDRGRTGLLIKGRTQEELKVSAPLAGADVSPDYFQTMRIRLTRGRLFDDRDTVTSPLVLIINERGAKLLWPDRDPIGQEAVWGALSPSNPYCRVVGVVENIRHQAAESEDGIEFYYPIAQWPASNSFYVIRTTVDPDSLAATLRRTILAAEPTLAVPAMKTMEQRIDESLWQQRLWGLMFTVFAVVALALAAVGLYGVMAHGVAQRTREIGIRMALGAGPSGVGAMVVREAMVLVAIGLVIGGIVAAAAGRFIAGLLYGVPAHDPATYLVVSAVLSAAALVAAWIPAYRASRIDPIRALRSE